MFCRCKMIFNKKKHQRNHVNIKSKKKLLQLMIVLIKKSFKQMIKESFIRKGIKFSLR